MSITDHRRRLVRFNRGIERITGLTHEEASGNSAGQMPQCDKADRIEVEFRRLFDGDGTLYGFMAIESDSSERKSLDAEVLRSKGCRASKVGQHVSFYRAPTGGRRAGRLAAQLELASARSDAMAVQTLLPQLEAALMALAEDFADKTASPAQSARVPAPTGLATTSYADQG